MIFVWPIGVPALLCFFFWRNRKGLKLLRVAEMRADAERDLLKLSQHIDRV